MSNKSVYFQIKDLLYGKLNIKEMILAFGYGLIVLLVIWVSVFKVLNLDYFSISKIHEEQFLLFVLDFIPFLFVIGFNLLKKYNESIAVIRIQKELIHEQLHEYAGFAKLLGEGDYSLPSGLIDDTTPIGKALLVLQENLIKSRKIEQENSWFNTGKDNIARVLRKYVSVDDVSFYTVSELVKYTNLVQGVVYFYNEEDNSLESIASYSYNRKRFLKHKFKVGFGLIGEVAFERQSIYRKEIPEDYSTLTSGILGDAKPQAIYIAPLIADDKLQGIIELGTIQKEINSQTRRLIEDTAEKLAQTLFNLKSNTKTRSLLDDSRKLTQELQHKQQEILESSEKISSVNALLETSHKQLEDQVEEIKHSEQRIQAILEHASEVISIYDSNSKLKYESLSVKSILGYMPSEESNRDGISFIHEQCSSQIIELLDTLIRIPYKAQTIEYKFARDDNSFVWCETTGRNFIENKAIEGIILTTRDITIHKLAEQENRMKSKMQALSENSPDMIVRLGVNGRVFYANPMIQIFTGLQVKSVVDKVYTDLPFTESFANMLSLALEKVTETSVKLEEECTIDYKDESHILTMSAIPERNDDDELESILIVAHDITQRKLIELEIQDKSKKIQDSINYAKRIQTSLLPTIENIREYLPKSFMFYRPKDVVSGDFPWMFVHKDYIYIAAVDCTGHGVPGALLSVIGYLILDSVTNTDEPLNPAEILDKLHYNVRRSLKQDVEGADGRDGMDVGLCKIGLNNLSLEFAGAHRPLLHLHKDTVTEIKSDRKAIGGLPPRRKKEQDFTNHVVPIESGDRIFFFSDGLPDQEGGPDGKKYGSRKVREVLAENYDLTIGEIGRFFDEEFYNWKGDYSQLDDVLLIGIEL